MSLTPSSSTLTPIACLIGCITPFGFHSLKGLAKVCLVMYPGSRGTLVTLPLSYDRIRNRGRPRATDRVLHLSISSTTIRFSTYFTSIDLFFWTPTWSTISTFYRAESGAANAGGTTSLTFAGDGGTSYLGRHPTCVFVSSAHITRR